MLIINADDLGRNQTATDNTFTCFEKGTITSSSIMVFMPDSERSARLAVDKTLDTGLHLNLYDRFTGGNVPQSLNDRHERIVSFLSKNKFSLLLYNPFLKNDFHYCFNAQYDEFTRLFGYPPSRIDGHSHMHLCTNMLVDRVIPNGLWVRRNFSYKRGERSMVHWLYRRIVDRHLKKHYRCVDLFYGFMEEENEFEPMATFIEYSKNAHVELMVHPEIKNTFSFLTDVKTLETLSKVSMTSFSKLQVSGNPSLRQAQGKLSSG